MGKKRCKIVQIEAITTSTAEHGSVEAVVPDRKFASMRQRIADNDMTSRRRAQKLPRREMGTPPRERSTFASRPSRISTRPKICDPRKLKNSYILEAELSVSIKNLYKFLKTHGLNVFRSQAPQCHQVHDSLGEGQKTTHPRGPQHITPT